MVLKKELPPHAHRRRGDHKRLSPHAHRRRGKHLEKGITTSHAVGEGTITSTESLSEKSVWGRFNWTREILEICSRVSTASFLKGKGQLHAMHDMDQAMMLSISMRLV